MIRWLGPLHLDADASGQMQLDAVVAGLALDKPAGYPRSNQLECEHIAPFGIGDLPALSTASYYQLGRANGAIPLARQTFTLDCSTQHQMRLRDKVNNSYPLRIFNVAEPSHWNQLYDCSITRVEHNNDPCGVLFPAMEILRFAYGSSSAMLQALTDGSLNHILDEVNEHSRMEDGVQVIHLPPGFQPEDAATFAWLLQDEFARTSALHVHTSIVVNRERRRSYPQPRLPYGGVQEFEVKGRTVTGEDGKERFLVHHILRVNVTLRWDVGIAAPTSQAGSGIALADQHRSLRLPDADPRRSRLDSSAAPGQRGATARLPALPSQFSDTRPLRVSAPKATSGQAVQVSGQISSPPTPWGTFSTDPSHEAGARTRRGTLAVPTADRAAPIQADFSAIRRIVDLIRKRGHHTHERPPSTFPGTSEPALIVEVERQGRFSYLVERERVGDRSSGPLIVAHLANCRRASENELEALLALRSGSRTWPQFDRSNLWRMERVNHAYTSDETFRDAILLGLCSPMSAVRIA